jgi:WD40 repeat protein
MSFVKLSDMYIKPSFYQPPAAEELTDNTDFPNLNSIEYRVKKPTHTQPKLQNFWEILEVDSLGQIVLVTNDYVTRIWNGSFWGYESFEDVAVPDKAVYNKQYDHLITNFKFIEPNIALVSDSSGSVTLWSTKAEIRNGYCPYSIVRKSEHIGRIDALELFRKAAPKALTGSTDCCIKVWDLSAGDICSEHTYRHAHFAAITGLSSSYSMATVFASCSRDKKWAIWDYRQRKPITALSLQHDFAYTTVYWSDDKENNENLLVGDESGCVYFFDIRNPRRHTAVIEAFKHPIHKLSFEGPLLAILGQTDTLKVYDTSKENKLIFENSDAANNVRDIHWNDVNSFHTIAWDCKIRKYELEGVN